MDNKKPKAENYTAPAAERAPISPERRALFEKHFPRKTYNSRVSKYGTITYILNHANPSENVRDFLNERLSLLGPLENIRGGWQGYRIENVKRFLEVWKGEEGERWREKREADEIVKEEQGEEKGTGEGCGEAEE